MRVEPLFNPGLQILAAHYTDIFFSLNHWNYSSLKAPFWRLYWLNRPDAALIIAGRPLRLNPGNLYLIPPQFDFGSRNKTAHCRQFFIHFQIMAYYKLRSEEVLMFPLNAGFRRLIQTITSAFNHSSANNYALSLHVRILLELALIELVKKNLITFEYDPRLHDVITFLEQHSNCRINNRQLAAQMHMHPRSMLRLFKAETGLSPQGYIRKKRLETVCSLLHFSDKPIKTIAEEAGFCDRYHLAKVFRAVFEMTPACFRRKVIKAAHA